MADYVARFGPAGNSAAFYDGGMKATLQAPGWLEKMGLNAYEYQCGRGVNIRTETAEALGKKAAEHGIVLSLHAPYYISLASDDPAKRDNSVKYILDSARAVTAMGGDRIVVHPGGLGGLSRSGAAELAQNTLVRAQAALDEEGLGNVHICPETMGKINQLGNLEEVLGFCAVDERMLPCVDFGHLNSRTMGGLSSSAEYAQVLDAIENGVGIDRARLMHIHFSKIEYTAGGEKKHLTFEDTVYGPEPSPLMELLARRGYTPVVICESAGTQDVDALAMMKMYRKSL